jgi:hypothetical protein
MSHSNRILQILKESGMPREERSMWMADEIGTRIMEASHLHDEQDPTWMPHYLQAKVDRWADVVLSVATIDRDPQKAVQRAYEGLKDFTARALHALNFDWNYKNTGHDSFLNEAAARNPHKKTKNPVAAVLRAIDLQKSFSTYARAKGIETFRKLATQYPEHATAAMDADDQFDSLCKGLKDCFNIKTLRQQLAAKAQVFSIAELNSGSLADLPAELDQWAENIRRLAEEGEPETALSIASLAVFRWSIVADSFQQGMTGHQPSLDEQKISDLAPQTAIREFIRLASAHKASAANILNSSELHGFEQISDLIDGKFDPWTLRDDIVKSLPPGTVENITKPRKFLNPGKDFC